MKITKQEFDSLFSEDITHKNYNIIIEKIENRMLEIIKYISTNLQWWNFGCGNFDPKRYKEFISIEGHFILPPPFDTYQEIPTYWLWEDFEKDFHKQVDDYRVEKEKEILENKQRFLQLQKSIKEKLSEEELKIIKFVQ